MIKTPYRPSDLAGLDDRQLLERCRLRDRAAMEEFYHRYSDTVYRLAWSILRNNDDAEEAVQDIFVKVYNSLDQFQSRSKITTWLYTVTRNQCLDFYRSRDRYRSHYVSNMDPIDSTGDRMDNFTGAGLTPDQEHSEREIRLKIIEAIKQLPTEYREAVYLKEIETLSYEEIAEIQGCRMGTVKSRLFRAREMLQDLLRDFYEEFKER